MEGLTLQIFDWLTELEELQAAELIATCSIENFYVDTLFDPNSEKETYMNDVTIYFPLKFHKKLDKYTKEITAIESAINESAQTDGIYVRNIDWRPCLQSKQEKKNKNVEQIAKILTHEYVDKQIRLMNSSIENNPHLALGISKELIETCCKYILEEEGIQFEKDWDMLKLIKETNKNIDLIPFKIDKIDVAKSSVAKILGGFSNIVHGITELRNSYGTGHGHSPEFKMLDGIYVKLAVTASSELVLFYLTLQKIKKDKSIDNTGK